MKISALLLAPAAFAGMTALAATNEAGTPTGTVHGNVESAYRLAIVQVCQPAGQNCRLAFVDTRKDDDVAALVGRHLGQGRPGEAPGVQVLAVCAGSWLASVSVQAGGAAAGRAAPGGASAVCGYPSAPAALSAALDACDSQTGGACRRAGTLRASWGHWDGRALPGRDSNPGRPYDTWPDGRSCESPLPLQTSAACSEQDAAVLREAGVQ